MSKDDATTDAQPPVTADLPDSVMQVTGVDHITLVGSNVEDTIAFYRDVLGMALVLRQPNLDAPEVTHLFFDPGDGRLLTFFVTEDRNSHQGPQRPGVGAVQHIAFSIDAEEFAEIEDNLEAAGQRYNEFDRGAFHSLYTTDHNGFVIELSAAAYHIPEDRRGEVLATAQRIRVEAGAEYVEDEHLAEALAQLDLPVEPTDLPSAQTGDGALDDE